MLGTKKIDFWTVAAPYKPATITQQRKKYATIIVPKWFSIKSDHTSPAARNPLYSPVFGGHWFGSFKEIGGKWFKCFASFCLSMQTFRAIKYTSVRVPPIRSEFQKAVSYYLFKRMSAFISSWNHSCAFPLKMLILVSSQYLRFLMALLEVQLPIRLLKLFACPKNLHGGSSWKY